MQAAESTQPRLGEWYSRQELFDAYPGYWVLLAFPDELTPEEAWDIMHTHGMLVEMSRDHDKVWQTYRTYKLKHRQTPTYFFATEQEEDVALVAGMRGIQHATADGLDEIGVVYAGQSFAQRLVDHLRVGIRRCARFLDRLW